MNRSSTSRVLRGRNELLAHASQAPDASALFAKASTSLRQLVPFNAAVWRVTDPITGLMTSPVRVENLDDEGCTVYWESELLAENVNPFHDLVRASVPAAGLRESTGDLPGRSAVYRQYLRPRGFDDELKAVLLAGGRPWGTISLFREQGRMPFAPADIKLLASLSTPLGQRLRSYTQPSPDPFSGSAPSPGLLLFDPAGTLISINDEVRQHLAEMPSGPTIPTSLGIKLPAWLHCTAIRARAIAEERDRGNARLRIRTRAGHWMVCHASCLREANGAFGPTAVIIEAATASEVAHLIIAAYELSDRELEITQFIARGLPTSEIAGQLLLSPHTVRDHIKTIFTKARVSSRGELVAKLFTEHYEPLGANKLVRVWDS